MDFWVKFVLSSASVLFGQFVHNPESIRKYQSVVENIYHNAEFLLVQLGSPAVQEPVAEAPQEPHADLPA